MNPYVARIVMHDCVERYLSRGKLVSKRATHYPHPSAAKRAIDSFARNLPRNAYYADICDTRDGERIIGW